MHTKTKTDHLSTLTHKELLSQTMECAKNEKLATFNLLTHLHEIQTRRLYAEIGYCSLWEYTVKELGYSEAAASERCGAMKLCFSLPDAHTKVKSGELSLTSASKLQRFMYAEKKRTGKEMDLESKANLIKTVAGKSTRELEKKFLRISPVHTPKETERFIGSGDKKMLNFSIDEETIALLDRLRELRGNVSLGETFKLTLKHYITKNDPLLKKERRTKKTEVKPISIQTKNTRNSHEQSEKQTSVRAPEVKKFIKSTALHNSKGYREYKNITVRSKLHKKAGAQCTYISPSGKRCECRTKLQTDHIKPLGKNGDSSFTNLRLLCPEHNRLAAIKEYGAEIMDRYLNT